MPTSPTRRVLDIWADALNRGDLDTVVGMYASDALLLATFAAEPAGDRHAVRAYFDNLGELDGLRVSIDDASIVEFGQAIAGLYTFAHRDGDRPVEQPSRFTFVVAPDAPRPILHHHSSQVPSPG